MSPEKPVQALKTIEALNCFGSRQELFAELFPNSLQALAELFPMIFPAPPGRPGPADRRDQRCRDIRELAMISADQALLRRAWLAVDELGHQGFL